jgi:hypothetical protein
VTSCFAWVIVYWLACRSTFQVKATTSRPRLSVMSDGRGVVARARAWLLADLAEAAGLTGKFSEAVASSRSRRGGHDPGPVARGPCEERG